MTAGRIVLTQKQLRNANFEAAYRDAGELMPAHVLYAGMTRNAGPWSAFVNDNPEINLVLKYASGKIVRTMTAAVYRHAFEATEVWETQQVAFALILPKLAEAIMLLQHRSYALLMRPNATILVINEGSGLQGFYAPSPLASGHDLIADTVALEREFSGWFELR